mgnify:CR=1 FL=1
MEEISLKAENIFLIGSFYVTNSLILSFLIFCLMVSFALFFRKQIKLIPGKIQSLVEVAFETLLNLMESVLGTREKAEKYFPLIATIFIFIWISNLIGIFPGVGSFIFREGNKQIPLLRSPASDLNFTIALAVISVFVTNIFGITALGFFKHIGKFFNFKNPINFFIGILELLSEISKMISLSFRLFGNVFAGEILLIIVFALAPYFAPIPFLFLEIFVGFIQAFVFAMLTLVSVSLHTEAHEHE